MTVLLQRTLSHINYFISLGSKGGVLFEYYLLLYGSRYDVSLLNKNLSGVEETNYDDEVMFNKYSSSYWYFASKSLYAVNQRCSKNLHHVTQQFEYRGLTRMGRALGSTFGILPAFRNQDYKKLESIGKYNQKVLGLVKSNGGILTWDNYCHYYGSPTPSTRPFNYQAANYTVVAISQYQFQERPSFVWRYLENIDTVVTSIPLDPLALLPVHDQVCSCPLYFSFLFRFFLVIFLSCFLRYSKMFFLRSMLAVWMLKVGHTPSGRTLLVLT